MRTAESVIPLSNMKFLVLFALFVCIASASGQGFEKFEFKGSSGDTLNYAFFEPGNLGANERLPLVVTLHGVGGRGREEWTGNCAANAVLIRPDMQEKFRSFILVPTTNKGETWASHGKLQGKGRLPDVFELIEKLLKDKAIDPNRIYVTGQSMGGVGTFGAIVLRPDLFAAAAPVCGGFPPEKAEIIAHLPIWVFHGDKDPTVPVEWSRDMVEALKKVGGKPRYTEFPGVGHNAWTPAYNMPEFWTWLFEQRRQKP